jgi:NitT/TauT family transport system permease protein
VTKGGDKPASPRDSGPGRPPHDGDPRRKFAPTSRHGPLLPVPPPWWRTLRADPPFQIRIALGAGLIALVLLVWWFLTRGGPVDAIISPSKLPSPAAVFASFDDITEHLGEGIAATLERVVLGVLLAALIGVGLGVLAASNRAVGAALTPLVIYLRSIPIGALLPLMVMVFSTGEGMKVAFIFFAIVAFVFSDTVSAISIVPQRYVETAQTLGASNRQILTKVLVPLALPDIVTSLRFQFGLAFGYVMIAEAIAAGSGLGFMLNTNERLGNIEQNYALLFVIAMLAFLIDFLLRYLQRGVFRWRQDL